MTSHNKHIAWQPPCGVRRVIQKCSPLYNKVKYVWNNFIWALNVIYHPKHTFAFPKLAISFPLNNSHYLRSVFCVSVIYIHTDWLGYFEEQQQ